MDRRSFLKGLAVVSASTIGVASLPHPLVQPADDGPLLPCDGRLLSRAKYPNLFKLIGSAYGDGDGETTFALPNMRQDAMQIYSANAALDMVVFPSIATKDIAGMPLGSILFVMMKESNLAGNA